MAKGYPVISGSVGPLVVCHIKATNQIIYRSKPRKYKQTAGSVAAQSSFGMAARAGKILRKRLNSILPFPKDQTMQRDFSGAMNKWLKTTSVKMLASGVNLPQLQDIMLNRDCSLRSRCKIDIEMVENSTGEMILRLPAFIPKEKLSAQSGTVSVEFRIAAAACQLEEGKEAGHFSAVLEFPFNDEEVPAQDIQTGIPSTRGNLIISGVYLVYYLKGNKGTSPTNNIKFMPAGVIAARYC